MSVEYVEPIRKRPIVHARMTRQELAKHWPELSATDGVVVITIEEDQNGQPPTDHQA